jgi:Flp pilus assembly protein TadD
MGLLQRAHFQNREAIDSFRRALAINPKYTMAHMQKAAVLFHTRDWEGCRSAYLEVLDSGLESGDIYLQLGQAEAELNRVDEAKEAFEKAARLTPDEPLVHYLQGKLFQRRGDREGARKAWARFLELEGHPEKHAEVADAMEQDERTQTRRKRTGS